MKKIILFEGDIETLGYFSEQLSKAFEKKGASVFLFDFQKEEESFQKLLTFCETREQLFMITFNFTGIRGEEIFLSEEGESFFDYFNIFCINIVVDHPYYYHELISKRPSFYEQISIDRFHEKYMKRFFPQVSLGPFLPLGGTALLEKNKIPSLEQRIYDVAFTGNYTPPHHFDRHITRIDDEYTAFYHSIIDTLIENPQRTMEEVWEEALLRDLGPLSDEELGKCMANMIFIDLYIRFYFRGEVIKTLADAGIKVHLFGSGWDLLECRKPENLILGGPLTSKGCLEELLKTKISLNVMPWFKDGAHDRIFNSMLNGALCLTDRSDYLQKNFADNENIKFYDLKDIQALPDMVNGLLINPAAMKEIIEAGYEKALSHTWESRAHVLLSKYESFL